MRDFSLTEYLGESLAALQGVYRGRSNDRWGWVAFAGRGTFDNRLRNDVPDFS